MMNKEQKRPFFAFITQHSAFIIFLVLSSVYHSSFIVHRFLPSFILSF